MNLGIAAALQIKYLGQSEVLKVFVFFVLCLGSWIETEKYVKRH
jgi:positive regulator of sigma E activity